jgi:hypothetical protein
MQASKQIPTEEDWGDYKADLDQAYAYRILFGKNLEQVIPEFKRNVLGRVEDLHFMPAIPFQYYIFAYRNFILSLQKDDYDAPDAASAFLGLVIDKLEESPQDILPVMEELWNTIEYVASSQSFFDADEDIYGSFSEKLSKIRQLYDRV